MMNDSTRQIGRQGENAACDYLRRKGYGIMVRNYTAPHGEIDIIAENEKYIVFVEVKYGMSDKTKKYGRPASKVNTVKQAHFRSAVQYYLFRYNPKKKPRIDVIEITSQTLNEEKDITLDIKHIENAF